MSDFDFDFDEDSEEHVWGLAVDDRKTALVVVAAAEWVAWCSGLLF